MTISEWNERYPLIGWGIFKRPFEPSVKYGDNIEKWREEYDSQELDFSTDAPDGVYDVFYGYREYEDVQASAVVVQNGEFLIIPPLVNALYELVHRNLTNRHIKKSGRVIERMIFDGKRFEIRCGS